MPALNFFARQVNKKQQFGFSLAELLIALLFTGILMAGFASVYKTNMGYFVSSSETTSSARRNRLSIDYLYDDLNRAGMLPASLFHYPIIDSTNPPFRIIPNAAYDTSVTPSLNTDVLDIYYDDFLPCSPKLASTIHNTSDQVASEEQVGDATTADINCRDAKQAQQIVDAYDTGKGLYALFLGSGYCYKLAGARRIDKAVRLTLATSSTSTYTGTGPAAGSTFTTGAAQGTEVRLIRPGRYVRYLITMRALDPSNPSPVPCLIRQEVTYSDISSSDTPFSAPEESVVVAENISGFKVMLSADGGNTWAGDNSAYTSWADIIGPQEAPSAPTLNYQLSQGNAPRPDMNSTYANPFWFREIPVLVRLDITSRTVNRRTEYASTAGTADYKYQKQSLILTPKHFGLAYQSYF